MAAPTERRGRTQELRTQLELGFRGGSPTRDSGAVPGFQLTIRSSARPKTSDVYASYWRFAAERQDILWKRARGRTPPWTEDEVLGSFRFTNAYRATDRVSQYLIRNVIYGEGLPSTTVEVFFRVILFKLFNRIETWELLEKAFGRITYEDYCFRHYDMVLGQALKEGRRIYSAAYIMPPGQHAFGRRAKHQNNLLLLESMMKKRLPDRLAQVPSMEDGFLKLKSFPTVGDFLAYQFITDLNYSEITNFSEMEYVVAGPGARAGLRKCFVDSDGLDDSELIRWAAESQEREFERLGLQFRTLCGRRLQLIDCQNLFCEVDKYARVAHPNVAGRNGRKRIKQRYRPKPSSIVLYLPPKWRLNGRLRADGWTDG